MGLARQSVQRIADLLEEKSMVRFEANPHHQRAKLVVLTAKGAAAVKASEQRQRPWARDITRGLTRERIAAALEVLVHIDERLSNGATSENSNPDKEDCDA